MHTSEIPKGRFRLSRFARFSLSSLLVAVTVSGIWLGIQVNRVRHEQLALKQLQQARAFVRFVNPKQPGQMVDEYAWEPDAPRWMRRLLGEDFFRQIGMVAFVGPPPGEVGAGMLSTKVTDEHLQLLKGLRGLKVLSLQSQTHIGDADLDHVTNLETLTTLCLWDTQITDDGLAKLTQLRGLKELGLSRTRISDSGVAHVAQLKRLELLELDGTGVTDDALIHLRKLKALRSLSLHDTKATATGVNGLKISLPNCNILWEEASQQAEITAAIPIHEN